MAITANRPAAASQCRALLAIRPGTHNAVIDTLRNATRIRQLGRTGRLNATASLDCKLVNEVQIGDARGVRIKQQNSSGDAYLTMIAECATRRRHCVNGCTSCAVKLVGYSRSPTP